MMPKMHCDIMLTNDVKNKKTRLIIDAKYYTKDIIRSQYGDESKYHSHNLYQIYTYVKNEDKAHSGNVSGMLLYAKTLEDRLEPAKMTIDGNDFYIRTLDLYQDFSDIKHQLDEIAKIIDVI